jgi:porphobilinogen synthase
MTIVRDTPDIRLTHRPRRLRRSAPLREMVAEVGLEPRPLIAPFFVVPGRERTEPIGALPGIARYSVDNLLRELERTVNAGIKSALLFGVVSGDEKDGRGSSAKDPHGPVPEALRAAREQFGDDLVLMTDVCLCGYTDHGHCGILHHTDRGVVVDNDASLQGLADMALAHAEAGADFVSPSDMMDGRVGYLREHLDERGFSEVGIMSYAIKYASAFYGPFREAAGSSPKGDVGLKDRKTYQMDPRNAREALREAALDEAEGRDMLMVKPALPYLDLLAQLRAQTTLPVVA